ncbi:DNA methyltransferase [candidate division KSB1 bacterium]|nr:DNA methyltransferase [candidate division KSB1 bacterium]
MNEIILQYVAGINKRYKTGISTEHSYRGDLQQLLEKLIPRVLATNEPARVACGAPDYIITLKNIPVGYIEAKDIGKPLDSKEFKNQFDRYRNSLDNLIITDYLDFWFYKNGKLTASIAIAKKTKGKITALEDNFARFFDLINNFCTPSGQTITSAANLSKMMAGKARLLSHVIENALDSDEEKKEDSSLKAQLRAFKDVLIHDITAKEFADIYSQTIAYGMFAARLHDPTLEDFSRQEAAEMIPKSNPFLRKLFQYIAGYDLDDRINWIVDALADIFRATNVKELLKDFGKATQQHDPVIHFYETFLAEYDPKLRKSRGVWYTPEPVVNFIVRAVDDILKKEFGLSQGLADTSKTTIEVDTQVKDKRSATGYKREKIKVHKVQILDPAAGTGTFLAEVVKQIYKKFDGQQGIWSNYVEEHLIPRLNGFEILMASYAMAHLKLEMLLQETGYKPKKEQRLRVFLTNSLEEHHPDTGTLWANWLSNEANEANYIKRDTPVMVVLGNPPYSGHSSNKSTWLDNTLLSDYKKEPGGGKLKEINIKWINDDYVKFIRYGQYFIEKNGEGLLAFINNHSFLDNPTFRGMRWNLLKCFDTIYCINLHGNVKKNEKAPDGSKDENVFDIQQGVSINLLIKTKNKQKVLSSLKYIDCWGLRDKKYNFLWNNGIENIKFTEITPQSPNYYFVPVDFSLQKQYDSGIYIPDLFTINSVGIVTARDQFCIQEDKLKITNIINDFVKLDVETARNKYQLGKDVRDWKVHLAQNDLVSSGLNTTRICPISYRPFDIRYTYYTGRSKGFHCMPRGNVMQHFFQRKNLGLVISKQIKAFDKFQHCYITENIFESSLVSNKTSEIGYGFPLFLFSNSTNNAELYKIEKTPNLNIKIIDSIQDQIGLNFKIENNSNEECFTPFDIIDYIYSILHSPKYREKYKVFLKKDFPKIPFPKDKKQFFMLSKYGNKLRKLHLLESPKVEQYITTYPKDGDNKVTRRITKKDFEIIDKKAGLGCVWINDEQYFEYVPVKAWEFYIGGYQPAQKWLKDRYGRVLSFDDIFHYQKIIVALTETDRIMKEIDKIDFM